MTLGSPGPLESPRLRLRDYTSDDVDSVLAIYGDATVTGNFGMSPFDRKAAERFLTHAVDMAGRRPRTDYLLAVVLRESQEIIGCARLVLADHPSAELGCVLRADRINRKIGTETGFLLFTLAFDQLRLHRVWSAIFPGNTLAVLAAQKSGMSFEGTLRDHLYLEGKWHDSAIYSILDHEWAGRMCEQDIDHPGRQLGTDR